MVVRLMTLTIASFRYHCRTLSVTICPHDFCIFSSLHCMALPFHLPLFTFTPNKEIMESKATRNGIFSRLLVAIVLTILNFQLIVMTFIK